MTRSEIAAKIIQLEEEIIRLRWSLRQFPQTFEEWQAEQGREYLQPTVVPVRLYGNRPPSYQHYIVTRNTCGFVDGDDPVLMKGSRAAMTKGERSEAAGILFVRMRNRVILRDRKTIITNAQASEYIDAVDEAILRHFRKRNIYIHSATLRAIGCRGYSTVGIDTICPSIIWKGRVIQLHSKEQALRVQLIKSMYKLQANLAH